MEYRLLLHASQTSQTWCLTEKDVKRLEAMEICRYGRKWKKMNRRDHETKQRIEEKWRLITLIREQAARVGYGDKSAI